MGRGGRSTRTLVIAGALAVFAALLFAAPLLNIGLRALDPGYEMRSLGVEYRARAFGSRARYSDFADLVADCPGEDRREFTMIDEGGLVAMLDDARDKFHPRGCRVYLARCFDPDKPAYRQSALCRG